MDERLDHKGATFVRDRDKAKRNELKHGIRFQRAVEALFDPFLRLIDASRNGEGRDAIVACDAHGRLLYVVHLLLEAQAIRIVSARRATTVELNFHDS